MINTDPNELETLDLDSLDLEGIPAIDSLFEDLPEIDLNLDSLELPDFDSLELPELDLPELIL